MQRDSAHSPSFIQSYRLSANASRTSLLTSLEQSQGTEAEDQLAPTNGCRSILSAVPEMVPAGLFTSLRTGPNCVDHA
jgi:hypothetical protein